MPYYPTSYRLWCNINSARHTCDECNYSSHNLANLRRHRHSLSCEIKRACAELPIVLCKLISDFVRKT